MVSCGGSLSVPPPGSMSCEISSKSVRPFASVAKSIDEAFVPLVILGLRACCAPFSKGDVVQRNQ